MMDVQSRSTLLAKWLNGKIYVHNRRILFALLGNVLSHGKG